MLLVGGQAGAAALGNSLAGVYKVSGTLNVGLSNSTPGYLPQRNEGVYYRDMCVYVHMSFCHPLVTQLGCRSVPGCLDHPSCSLCGASHRQALLFNLLPTGGHLPCFHVSTHW